MTHNSNHPSIIIPSSGGREGDGISKYDISISGLFFSPKMDTFPLLQSSGPWKYMLSERNQSQKVTYGVIPFLWNV